MIDPKLFDDLAQRINAAMPGGLRELQTDLDKTIRSAVQNALGKLDLVTREEFDIQSRVLARTRQKLEDLTGRVEALERQLLDEPPAGGTPAAPEQDMDGG
ncbi:accessory factor UbiK family protein [Thiohalobacter sp. IOR34]|uniref:ubiquinone biosynthesis accessory factor UbiK n=1 Tax=Thiohalobacter sp. IOR34 TaxID=3057176 RepID=UPI0025B0D0B8|nr:accessory factor UbiK family protein [Thiohalobacter sp. IOR34]WJW75656.1 accessory factor UbiK family protein [Thiohalobacter sp. IOR34]